MIHLLDVSNGRELKSLRGHSDWTSFLLFLDGDHLVSFGNDGKFRTWNLKSTLCSSTMPHAYNASVLALFNVNHQCVVLQVENGGAVALRNLHNKQLHFSVNLLTIDRYEISLSQDAQTLAAASSTQVVLADIASGKTIRTLPVPVPRPANPHFQYMSSKDVSACCFSRDNRWLAVSYVTNVYVWDLQTGEHTAFQPPSQCATDLLFSADCQKLIMKDRGPTMTWIPATNSFAPFVESVRKSNWNIEVKYSPCGKLVAVGQAGTVRMYDASTMELRWSIDLDQHAWDVLTLEFSPESSRLAVGRATVSTWIE